MNTLVWSVGSWCAKGQKLVLTGIAVLGVLMSNAQTATSSVASGGEEGNVALERDRLLTRARDHALNSDELFALSLAFLGSAQIDEARTTANLALGATPNPKRKAVLYHLMAQCTGAKGQYAEALNYAEKGQQLDPRSKELAYTRLVYAEKAGMKTREEAASDHLKSLDPSFKTEPVFAELGNVIIVKIAYKATVKVFRVLVKVYRENEHEIHEMVSDLKRTWKEEFGKP